MATRTYESLGTHPSGGAPSARWLALAVLCVSLLMVNLDNLVLNVALPTLVRDLHATTTELQWIVDAYVIVFAGLLLVAGSVADRIGRKRVFIVGLVAFAAGSTVITNPRGHHEPVRDHVGVGSAANGAFLQVGGALGVAIIGSLLNTRYQDTMSAALAPLPRPSFGHGTRPRFHRGCPRRRRARRRLPRRRTCPRVEDRFVSGMDLGLEVGAAVAVAGVVIALLALPSRENGR